MSIEVETEAFVAALRAEVEEIKVPARATQYALAEAIAEAARRHARRGKDPTPRGQPHIADSISVVQKSKNIVEVRVHSDHAYFMEFGTFDTRPQPYMRPAIEEEAY